MSMRFVPFLPTSRRRRNWRKAALFPIMMAFAILLGIAAGFQADAGSKRKKLKNPHRITNDTALYQELSETRAEKKKPKFQKSYQTLTSSELRFIKQEKKKVSSLRGKRTI